MECICEVERTSDPRCAERGMCGMEKPAMTPAQKAYGTLWRELSVTSQLIRIARLQLRDGLTLEERRAAVAWSIETYGPVTDSEAIAADIQAGVFPEKSTP